MMSEFRPSPANDWKYHNIISHSERLIASAHPSSKASQIELIGV
jgi:hypothetical protein